MKTCKKNFWKILIFCWCFCELFASSIDLSKVGVATIILVLRPCNHHNFTITSQERSTESFIKISLLVLKIFNILFFRFLFLKQKSAIIGTEWANDGWLSLFQEVLKIGNVEYFWNQWRYFNETFSGPYLWCACWILMIKWVWH